MTKKESYWQKHKQQIGTHEAETGKRKDNVVISDALRAEYETGKVILLDKSLHWTSFDAVRKIRNSLRIKKVGHAGTLDPLATGLLIICTGKYTKNINEYMSREKEYTGSFTLGATTPTYDLESATQDHKDISGINEALLLQTVQSFTGEIQQFPPVYSAIKQQGTPLYELARRGEEVELKARTVTIRLFEITGVELPLVHFRIVCSTGTYIRSIAHDFGQMLGCGAYLSCLRRTRIGSFEVKDADTIDQWVEKLQPLD